jgi:DNA-binding NarL/FixJ family response regulator
MNKPAGVRPATKVEVDIAEPKHTEEVRARLATSSKEEQDLIRSYELGANSYIQKPVDFEQFRQTVKTVGLYWMVINQRPVANEVKKSARQGAS